MWTIYPAKHPSMNLLERFQLTLPDFGVEPRYNIAPTQGILTAVSDGNQRHPVLIALGTYTPLVKGCIYFCSPHDQRPAGLNGAHLLRTW